MEKKFYFVNVISHDGLSVDRFPIRRRNVAFSLCDKFAELGSASFVSSCIGRMPTHKLTTNF